MQKSVIVQNSTDSYAKSAMEFIQEAAKFKSEIFVLKDDCKINAKSIMGILASGIEKGAKITLEAKGPDEEKALEQLSGLIENFFLEQH